MSEPNKPVGAIFDAAIELPAERRAVYLDTACAGDGPLRQRVEALLRAHELAGTFMGNPAVTSQRETIPATPSQKPGDRIGRYKLLQQIGEGGCGVVYMAEQEEPVRRRVALKVIKLGMDTKSVIARFEAERQALALMDHPNIAKVLDAGATDTGRPYFVMELVRGIKITDYCDENKLSTVARLELFVQVCQAIQHAHQKGIIHRDIKPSNILVADHDGVPVPKIIDFGIAKATTDQRLTDKTLFTAFEQFIGTPAYMSPEQARLSGLDIDTRSDIYSLGVLLYELLTGKTPFEARRLLEAGLDEIRRIIRDEEPLRPSTRLQTLGAAEQTTVADHRQSVPPKLLGIIRGDLDWIVMKALEKERARRYETASAFAADIQRHLNNEPVTASPPGNLYKFQKLVQRNKLGIAAAGAVIAALIFGLGISTWMFFQEKKAHEQTIVAEREQSRLREAAEQSQVAETGLRQQSEHLRRNAEDEAEQLRHQVYASDMNMAFQAWDKGDLIRVDRLLDEHRPKPGEEDLRGFEWFYLWRLCHSDQLTLREHNALMRAVAFSPDGRLLATAGDDSTARIWDAHTGKELSILGGHTGGVNAVAFSPDGKTLATGAGDKTISLWDVATGKELTVLWGNNYDVTALAFGPGGNWLASANGLLANDGLKNPIEKYVDTTLLPAEIKVWDVQLRKPILTLTGHTKSILSLAVSPDGTRLASGSADGTVKLWEVATGNLEMNLNSFKGPVFAVAFSPDAHSLAVGGGDPYREQAELKILDLATHAERMTFNGHDGPVFTLAFSPDGKTLASGGLDQIIRLWDVVKGDEVRNIKGHRASIWSLAWDPTGAKIASASWDETVKVWDALQPQGQQVIPGSGDYSGCFSPDGKYLIRSGSRLKVFELGTTNPPYIIPDYMVTDSIVAMSPDGKTLASAGMDAVITLWEVGTWRRLATLQGHADKIWSLAFSPDSRTLASSDASYVRLWDVKTRIERNVIHFKMEDRVAGIFFTPDGRTLITGDEIGVTSDKVWGSSIFVDVMTGQKLRSLPGSGVALSPDGRYLMVRRAGLGLFDLKTMELKWLVHAHKTPLYATQFSPDGRTLATASWDGTAKLWNVASGQEMFSYRAPGVLWDAVFSPDGKWLSVGSGSASHGEVALFQGATPAEVEAADSPAIYVQPVSQTTPEGRTVIFNVSATGTTPLAYQWCNGTNNLTGQTNAILTLTNATLANAGNYSVVITNLLGSATSSNVVLNVQAVHEVPIAEVNFQDKQPSWYNAVTYSENPVPLVTNIMEVAGEGVGGATGLVMTADSWGFTNDMDQGNSGFGLNIGVFASMTNGIDTTNLNLYKLYATIKTAGLAGESAFGRIQWQFMTPYHTILTREVPVNFTTNFQVYSFVLSDGSTPEYNLAGSSSEFTTKFDQINALQLGVVADQWLNQYNMDAKNAFYISNVRFMRLVPTIPAPPAGATNHPAGLNVPKGFPQMAPQR